MKVLHILRSPPDRMVRELMSGLSRDNESKEFALYREDVDYDRLIKQIFESERVICWW